jgi:Uma2 family endonuclease
MEPEQPRKMWTYDELASLPDGHRYEIFDGELFVDGQPYRAGAELGVVSPSPTRLHQRLSKRFFVALYRALEETRLAEVLYAPLDVVITPSRTVQPDLLVVRTERRHLLEEQGLAGAPDLVVEVLSPSTAKHDAVDKRQFYARMGVREYWLVDPDRDTVQVLGLIEGGLTYRELGWYTPGDTARSETFPFELDVAALFRDDDA